MTKFQKISLSLLRISVGWFMFYAAITKVLNPEWSAEGYLKGAKTFTGLYNWFASPAVLPVINFINEWGLTLLGVSLILGLFVRLSSVLGSLLMLLYYLPVLTFPYVEHGIIVEEHIIYIGVLMFFAAIGAGRYYGLDTWCANLPICSKVPMLRRLIG